MATVSTRKFAVVTGASSGIGFELALQCVRNGYDVLISAENDAINDAAEKLKVPGAMVYELKEDLSKLEGVERLYQRIIDIGRDVDALLLNAVTGIGGAFLETSLEEELSMIALNCGHTVHLAKRVLSDMVANRSGRVLITGSALTDDPNPYQAVYGATKAFLYSFGQALREELEPTGVTVTLLEAGSTDTEFFLRSGMLDTGMTDSAAQVAKDGFEGMIAGQPYVLAGSLLNDADEPLNEAMLATEPKPHHRRHQ
jgi:short-subunit dehydrogenase